MEIPEEFRRIFDAKLLEDIENNSEFLKVPAGETILKFGSTIRVVPIILKGVVKVSRLDDDGHAILLYYINPLESCAMTFTCCLQSKLSQIEAVAEQDVELLAIPIDVMDKWMNEHSSWKAFIMNTIQARFDELLKTIDQIAFSNLDVRLVDYLNKKADVTGSKLINLSHDQIAQELATSRVVISRLLKKLENDKKLLLYRNQIKLLTEL